MRVAHLVTLVSLSFLLLIASYLAPFIFSPNDPGLGRLTRFDGYGALINTSSNVFLVLPVLVALMACIGVAFLQNWGRYLYLAWVAYSVVISLAYGYRVSSPVDEFLGAAGFVLDGTILAVVFLSPLSTKFENARP